MEAEAACLKVKPPLEYSCIRAAQRSAIRPPACRDPCPPLVHARSRTLPQPPCALSAPHLTTLATYLQPAVGMEAGAEACGAGFTLVKCPHCKTPHPFSRVFFGRHIDRSTGRALPVDYLHLPVSTS